VRQNNLCIGEQAVKKIIKVRVTPERGIGRVQATIDGHKIEVNTEGVGYFEAEPGEHFVHYFAAGEPGAALEISIAGSEGLKLKRLLKVSKHGAVAGLHKIRLHVASDPDDWPGPRLRLSERESNAIRK
jgi:hypothetical protein